MKAGCVECQMGRSAKDVYERGLEASVRRAAQLNTSEAWGKVASIQSQVRHIKELWARHRREVHGYPGIT